MEYLGTALFFLLFFVVGTVTFFPEGPLAILLKNKIHEYGTLIFCGGALLAIAIGIAHQPADVSLKDWWESGAQVELPPRDQWLSYHLGRLWNDLFRHIEGRYFGVILATALIGGCVNELWKWFREGPKRDRD